MSGRVPGQDDGAPSGEGPSRGRTAPERRINLAPRPTEASTDIPWPKASAVYRKPSVPKLTEPLYPNASQRMAASHTSQPQGFFGKVGSWLAGSDQEGKAGASSRNGVPDFLSTSEDPDKGRLHSLQRRKGEGAEGPAESQLSAEAQWRARCLRHARHARLRHVEEMRLFYVDPGRVDGDGARVVVAVGAHYRPKAVSQEDVLLHIVQEMEKVGRSPYVVVYFQADTRLALLPDTDFFSGVHSALLPCHRQNLKAIYVVHPTALLKSWILLLRLQEPEVYSKVQYVERLSDLEGALPVGCPELPQHVLDCDARRRSRAGGR
eukprot:jgi/Botrbrau1/4519/Bobra.60_2s0010.1